MCPVRIHRSPPELAAYAPAEYASKTVWPDFVLEGGSRRSRSTIQQPPASLWPRRRCRAWAPSWVVAKPYEATWTGSLPSIKTAGEGHVAKNKGVPDGLRPSLAESIHGRRVPGFVTRVFPIRRFQSFDSRRVSLLEHYSYRTVVARAGGCSRRRRRRVLLAATAAAVLGGLPPKGSSARRDRGWA